MALPIDDADMAGAPFRLHGLRRIGAGHTPRQARRGLAHALGADEGGALAQIGVVEQACPATGRGRNKVGVGHILAAVGKGQARRLGIEVQPIGAGQTVGQNLRRRSGDFKQAQDLHDRQVARTRRRHAADSVDEFPIGADGLAGLDAVRSQVGHRQTPRVAGMPLHTPGDIGRDRAAVHRRTALCCDGAQHLRQRRVAQQVAHRMGLPIGAVKVPGGLGIKPQRRLAQELAVHARAQGKTLLGQADRRLEQARPGQAALRAVGLFEHLDGTRHTHGAAADHSFVKRHGLAVGQQEQPLVDAGRRGLAAIPGLHLCAVPVQQKRTAANAAGLRFHQGQHHLHGHRSIQRRATSTQHLVAGFGSQGVGGSHRKVGHGPTGFSGISGCAFGLRWQRWRDWDRRRTGRQQHSDEHPQDRASPARPPRGVKKSGRATFS